MIDEFVPEVISLSELEEEEETLPEFPPNPGEDEEEEK